MKPLAMALLLTLGAYLTTRDALDPSAGHWRARVWCGALAVVFVVGAGFWVWVATI